MLGFLFQKAGVRADPLLEFALASRPNATVEGENGENLPDTQCVLRNRRQAGGPLLQPPRSAAIKIRENAIKGFEYSIASFRSRPPQNPVRLTAVV